MPAIAQENTATYPPFTDKYVVEGVIGRGGMGTVYQARHARLGHLVAIKALGEELRVHPELVKRFEREARAASALSSPHAVRVHDIDQAEDGTPFFVMEMLQGRDLANLVENDGPQPIERAIRWLVEACDAIAEAHRLGIVHRDIKPSNLLLCDSGSIKVLDFGIAKRIVPEQQDAALTAGFVPLGTPAYMSPEQIRCAKDVDARTDIWSLGVTLYELVTGRPPYDHEVPQACIAAIIADPIPDPRCFAAIPDDLARVINKTLAKDPAGRYQSVDELVLALAPFIEDMPHSEQTPSWKVITGARRQMAKSNPTLAGDVILELRQVSGVESNELGAEDDRSEVRSRELTPSPVALRTSVPPRGRRLRSIVAMAAAAALGLVALVVTPRFTTPRELDPARAVNSLGARSEPSPIITAPAPASPHLETASASAYEPIVAPVPSPKSAEPKEVASLASPVASAPKPRAKVHYLGGEHTVHGGLSGPGF